MKIPNKISIGQTNYKIKMVKIVNWGNKNVIGNINYSTKKIRLKKQEDDRANEDTFFHELAHGLIKELEYNHPRISSFRNNEEFIQEMGLTMRNMFLQLKTDEVKK